MARGSPYDYRSVPEEPAGVWPSAARASAAAAGSRGLGGPGSPAATSGYGPDSPGSGQGKEDETAFLARLTGRRRTTDACGLCVFVAFWIGMIAVTYVSLRKGDPRRLFHGFDYAGRLCGVEGEVHDKPLIYWPRPDSPGYPICIASCPNNSDATVNFPSETAVVMDDAPHSKGMVTITSQDMSMPTYATKRVGGHFCLPAEGSPHAVEFTDALLREKAQSYTAMLRSWLWDIGNAWPVLIVLAVTSALLAYAYLYLLRHGARALTWGLVSVITLSCTGLAAYFLLVVSKDKAKATALFGQLSGQPIVLAQIVGWCSVVAAVSMLVFVSYVFSSMRKAVGCIEAAFEAIWAQQMLLRMPFLEVAVSATFTLLWVTLFTFVASSGDVVAPSLDVNGTPVTTRIRKFTPSHQQKLNIVYYVIGYIWGMETIMALFQFAISYCAVVWYFTPCQADLGKTNVQAGLWRKGFVVALRYHLGSLAVGAAVAGLFRPIAGPVTFIAKHARANDNQVTHAISSTFMCCIWCFEEVFRYINKNAVIHMVLKPGDFFTSAGRATRMLAEAADEVAPFQGAAAIFQQLGILAIALGSALAAFWTTGSVPLFASASSQLFVENRLLVAMVAALVASVVAAAFMSLFEVVSDSLLFCWLTDGEDGSIEFAPRSLRSILGDPVTHQKARQEAKTKRGLAAAAGAALSAAMSGLAATADATQAAAAGAARMFGSRNTPGDAGTGGAAAPPPPAPADDAAAVKAAEAAKKAAEEAARKVAQAEAAQKAAEEDATRRVAEAEAGRRAAEEEAERRVAEALAAKRAAEEEAAARLAAVEAALHEAEAARRAAEEAREAHILSHPPAPLQVDAAVGSEHAEAAPATNGVAVADVGEAGALADAPEALAPAPTAPADAVEPEPAGASAQPAGDAAEPEVPSKPAVRFEARPGRRDRAGSMDADPTPEEGAPRGEAGGSAGARSRATSAPAVPRGSVRCLPRGRAGAPAAAEPAAGAAAGPGPTP